MIVSVLPLLLLSLHIANGAIYYVTTDNNHHFPTNNNFHMLEYYLADPDKYFISHTHLYFLPGHHHLNKYLSINHIENFTLTGKDSTIICTPHTGISVINTTDFKLMNINLLNCGISDYYLYSKFTGILNGRIYFYPNGIKIIKCNVSILLINCASVVINSVNINVNIGFTGLLAANMRNTSNITDLKVHVNCFVCPKFTVTLVVL